MAAFICDYFTKSPASSHVSKFVNLSVEESISLSTTQSSLGEHSFDENMDRRIVPQYCLIVDARKQKMNLSHQKWRHLKLDLLPEG